MGVPRTEATGRVVDTTATATAALVRSTGVAAAICSGIGVEKGSPVQLTRWKCIGAKRGLKSVGCRSAVKAKVQELVPAMMLLQTLAASSIR